MKGYIKAFVLFVALVFIFSYLLTAINEKTGTEREKTLQEAVRKASVQCYAIEGRYPASVDYLEENYGFYEEGLEPALGNNLSYKLKARSIAVLKSKEK